LQGCRLKGKPNNERKCEGMSPHTPKGAFTLELESWWTPKFSKSDCKGQNPMD